MKTTTKALLVLLVALVIGGGAYATVTYRSAIPMGTAASWNAATGGDPSAAQGPWIDNTTATNLRYQTGGSGGTANYVPYCVPTTTGDVCSWNSVSGTWQRSAGGGGGTIATTYAAGAAAADQTMVESVGKGGGVVAQYDGVGTAQTYGFSVNSTTAAALNSQQNSPVLGQCGNGWGTSGGASQAVCAGWQVTPVQASNAGADYSLYQQNGGGSLTQSLQVAYGVGNSTSSGMTVIGQANSGTAAISFDPNNSGEIYFWSSIASARADAYPWLQINTNGITPIPDSYRFLGYASHRFVYAALLDSGSNKGTCDATTRGAMTTVPSGAGVGDTLQVCMKGTADTYAWRTAFTAP